jgi:hypothetical protein
MQAVIDLILESRERQKFDFNQIPDKCPICNIGIEPIIHFGYFSNVNHPVHDFDTQVIFQCPLNRCQSMFIGYYESSFMVTNYSFHLHQVAPIKPEDVDFGSIIKKISPNFIEIYSQAQKAEQVGWLQVAGPGFRKSLEFLIKDYCSGKTEKVDEKENIKKEFIGVVIEKYIDESRIKEMAKRATWLGNDETHYVRKWENKDLNDLKNLISLTLGWINIVEISNQYIEEMPKNQK